MRVLGIGPSAELRTWLSHMWVMSHCKVRGCLELLECGEDTEGPFPESNDAKVSWTILGSLQQECCSCRLLKWWAWLRLPLGTKMLKFYRASEDRWQMSNCYVFWILCCYLNFTSWAEEIAQFIKYLLCKPEDLGVNPRTHVKMWGTVVHACNSISGLTGQSVSSDWQVPSQWGLAQKASWGQVWWWHL